MVAIDFGRQSNPGRDSQMSSARLVNAYMEVVGEGGKGQYPISCLPGLTRWDSATTTYADYVARGVHTVTGKGLYAVLGNKLVRFIDTSSYEEVGTIAGTSENGAADDYGYVGMASDMESGPYLGIVTEDGLYYYCNTATGVLTLYEGADLPAPKSITFLDRYFVFAVADGRIFHTAVGDISDVDPLSFAYAESRADGLQNVVAHRGALVALGDQSLEIWENVGTSPFAFSPIRADIDVGCLAGQTVTQIKEGIAWVDQYGQVQYMRGSEPEPIGTPSLVRAIEALTDTQKATLRGCHYQFSDNNIYSLTSDVWTWEYNAKTKLWHERESRNSNNWRGQLSAEFDGKFIIAEDDTGYLYYIDPTSYTEGADYYTVIAQSPPQHLFPNGGIVNSVAVDAVRGVGRTAGDADAQDPQLMLDWSIDGGKTWTGGERESLGAAGEYSKRITFRRLGRFEENGISFRLSCSSSVMRSIMAADVQFSPLRVGGADMGGGGGGGQANEQGRQ